MLLPEAGSECRKKSSVKVKQGKVKDLRFVNSCLTTKQAKEAHCISINVSSISVGNNGSGIQRAVCVHDEHRGSAQTEPGRQCLAPGETQAERLLR